MIWYSEPLDKVCQELETDPKSGLTEETLQHRREQYALESGGSDFRAGAVRCKQAWGKAAAQLHPAFFRPDEGCHGDHSDHCGAGIPWTECIPCADRRRTGLD